MKKLVIFDLDGTLTDSLKSIQYCTNLTIGEFGFEPLPLEPFRYFVGDGANELMKRVATSKVKTTVKEVVADTSNSYAGNK